MEWRDVPRVRARMEAKVRPAGRGFKTKSLKLQSAERKLAQAQRERAAAHVEVQKTCPHALLAQKVESWAVTDTYGKSVGQDFMLSCGTCGETLDRWGE